MLRSCRIGLGASAGVASIGERLKAARLERGLSIDEIVEQRVISKDYAIALEQDDHGVFPAEFYATSFLRQYSEALGLASDDLVETLRRELADVEKIPAEPSPHPAKAGSQGLWIAAIGKIRRWVRAFVVNRSNAVVAGVLMFAGVIGWWYVTQPEMTAVIVPNDESGADFGSIADSDVEEQGAIAPETSRTETSSTKNAASAAEPAPSGSTEGAELVSPPPSVPGSLSIELRASGEVWVRMVVDGGSAQEAILRAGNRRTVQAQQRMQFTVGNAGMVTLVIDGQVQDSLGAPGQVRHIEVDRGGWKTVPPGTFY